MKKEFNRDMENLRKKESNRNPGNKKIKQKNSVERHSSRTDLV
jgi:hypothetical protein